MKTIKATGNKSNEYGHSPGSGYRDVDVSITRRPSGRWSVEILETWGYTGDDDEEQGRKKVIGRGSCLDDAVHDARDKAAAAKIDTEYLAQALSEAETKAEEDAEAAEEAPLADVSIEALEAELARRKCAAKA